MSNYPQNINGQATMADSSPVVIASNQSAVPISSSIKDSRGTHTALTTTNLASLANSATVGWQSERVNLTATALDYEIFVKLTMQAGAPASDKAAYVYVCPFYHYGTNYYAASQGTATLPTGTQGATTIASPNNLRLLGVLSYTTTTMVLQDTFLISNCFGAEMPDSFSIIIINFTGATTNATVANNVVAYKTINRINA